jgi:hypothetical protein
MTLLLMPRFEVVEEGGDLEAVVNWGATGATLGVRVIDNAGNTTITRKTDGILEDPASSGIYRRNTTAPDTEGAYTIVWDDSASYTCETLYVTADITDFTSDSIGATSYTAVAQGFDTGLTGTIAVRVLDNQGNTSVTRTTSGIIERPAGSGIYLATLTTPPDVGLYTVVWDDGNVFAADSLKIGEAAAVPIPPTVGTLTLAAVSLGDLEITGE